MRPREVQILPTISVRAEHLTLGCHTPVGRLRPPAPLRLTLGLADYGGGSVHPAAQFVEHVALSVKSGGGDWFPSPLAQTV